MGFLGGVTTVNCTRVTAFEAAAYAAAMMPNVHGRSTTHGGGKKSYTSEKKR